jgi:hypothetical protein
MGKKFKHNILINFKRFLLVSFLFFIAISWVQGQAAQAQQSGNPPSDYITLYPGVFTERAKALAGQYIAENRALEERGPVDIQALINGTLPKDTPGIVSTPLVVTEAMLRYNNEKYDPENPVLNDTEYAKKLGYENIFGFPTFAANDDSILKAFPSQARDKLLVSDLNHNITYYRPIYPGDTLYTVITKRFFIDATPPEGGIYRSLAIQSEASIYNQKGEKVNDCIFRVTENLGILKEGKTAISSGGPMAAWVSPAWTSRPAHYYTDEDWEYIKKLWKQEKRQGATPLYWEDVKVGDYNTPTVDGPLLATPNPTQPYGMGIGGSRTMKKEMLDSDIFKTMIRDENTGIYTLPNREDYIPTAPEGGRGPGGGAPPEGQGGARGAGGPPPDGQGGDRGAGAPPGAEGGARGAGAPPAGGGPGSGDIDTREIHRQTGTERAVLINYMGRDVAIRHINNWMGDYGWIYNIRWSIMAPSAHAAVGLTVPESPLSERYVQRVPKLAKANKVVNAHGLTTDMAIVYSYVEDKYVRDGEFFVDLLWWIETIEGDIFEEGGATVKLPSKKVK